MVKLNKMVDNARGSFPVLLREFDQPGEALAYLGGYVAEVMGGKGFDLCIEPDAAHVGCYDAMAIGNGVMFQFAIEG